MRSQTLPRTSGTQARKALFEKLEPDGGKYVAPGPVAGEAGNRWEDSWWGGVCQVLALWGGQVPTASGALAVGLQWRSCSPCPRAVGHLCGHFWHWMYR